MWLTDPLWRLHFARLSNIALIDQKFTPADNFFLIYLSLLFCEFIFTIFVSIVQGKRRENYYQSNPIQRFYDLTSQSIYGWTYVIKVWKSSCKIK